eukprot:scaffold768_cov382-Prasinococcus_capsulatus_cf.AAC.1
MRAHVGGAVTLRGRWSKRWRAGDETCVYRATFDGRRPPSVGYVGARGRLGRYCSALPAFTACDHYYLYYERASTAALVAGLLNSAQAPVARGGAGGAAAFFVCRRRRNRPDCPLAFR